MKKGVSPVVAVVLLIAIAVIAAVGVWYWIGAYTSKPNIQTSQKSFTVSACTTDGDKVLVYNNGGEKLTTNAEIYYANGTKTDLSINFSGAPLDTGQSAYVNITGGTLSSGATYQIVGGDYPLIQFTC